MPNMVFLLTHDFKPAFRRTLRHLDSHEGGRYEVSVLLDDRSEVPGDLGLKRTTVVPCKRRPSPFDPLGQAHNFYLDLIASDLSMLGKYERFWIFENDAYFHGNPVDFMEAHDRFDDDLLVPEFGLRDPKWQWLASAKGIEPQPKGVTAVAYRASSRLMGAILECMSGGVKAHMEVLLPHLCHAKDMKVSQFIPDLVGCCNTFWTPLVALIEEDVRNGTSKYVQRKLYHPVKS